MPWQKNCYPWVQVHMVLAWYIKCTFLVFFFLSYLCTTVGSKSTLAVYMYTKLQRNISVQCGRLIFPGPYVNDVMCMSTSVPGHIVVSIEFMRH